LNKKLHKGKKLATSKSKKWMEPKKYFSTLRKIQFNEIYLDSCSSEIKRENFEFKKHLDVKISDRASYVYSENVLKVMHKYFLTAKKPDMKDDFAIKVTARFSLRFTTKAQVNDDFFNTFRELNLYLNSWPYFREFVQSMTQRMNIPPLTLPFHKRGGHRV